MEGLGSACSLSLSPGISRTRSLISATRRAESCTPLAQRPLSLSSLERSCDSSGGWAPRACAVPGLLPSRALPVSLPPADPSDQRLSRTPAPRQGEGGSAWSGLEGIRHPLARFLLRLPATPCLPPYCFPVVLAPVKAHSDFHKTEQRKVLKCREGLGNTPTCLPPSTPKISASPPDFSSYQHPLPITLAHTAVQLSPTSCSLQSTALKWFRAPPREAGGRVSGVSELLLPLLPTLLLSVLCGSEGGRAGAFLLPLPRNLCCRTHGAC